MPVSTRRDSNFFPRLHKERPRRKTHGEEKTAFQLRKRTLPEAFVEGKGANGRKKNVLKNGSLVIGFHF